MPSAPFTLTYHDTYLFGKPPCSNICQDFGDWPSKVRIGQPIGYGGPTLGGFDIFLSHVPDGWREQKEPFRFRVLFLLLDVPQEQP